jgi:hypothetical protein
MTLSLNPRPKMRGPNRPVVMLLAEMLAPNHRMATWRSARREAGWRPSGGTRVIPRASKPERPSMALLIRRRVARTPPSGGTVPSAEEDSFSLSATTCTVSEMGSTFSTSGGREDIVAAAQQRLHSNGSQSHGLGICWRLLQGLHRGARDPTAR